jgi:hypothetical protein
MPGLARTTIAIALLTAICLPHSAMTQELPNSPPVKRDYIWDCASYAWKWEDKEYRRANGLTSRADSCVQRLCGRDGYNDPIWLKEIWATSPVSFDSNDCAISIHCRQNRFRSHSRAQR